ncbi:hypothetical protein KNU79_gp04 [Gordonia phage NadineRae]|uniref:Uncharacterized protein n=1 Tax=Gordonia phage NadineRae TaxID=2652882 RepID=A0A5P8DFC2_9CAUD|nr:hypothetical protein KNU79_gp04 [Gordonia phage NadineRae]QFP97693.1 hypothetical protein SEA_NADINERAE_4 [Gordonia phage NadineRae]
MNAKNTPTPPPLLQAWSNPTLPELKLDEEITELLQDRARTNFPSVPPPLPPNVEIGYRMHELAEEMREKVGPTLQELGRQARGVFQTIEGAWPTLQRIVEEAQRELDERNPPDPNSLRDERGIKRPASVPPMWANSPTRQRRRR